ncbi:MAG: SBBP repeat-containing protein [Bacteroidia bacterium]|nr:SBBP repeat-containing protein [Bacteroidia bacterium]
MKRLIFFLGFLVCILQVWAKDDKAQSALAKADRLFFIENKGQWHSDVLYLCRMGGLDAWITKYGVNYTFYKIERNKAAEFSRSMLPKHKFDHDPENEILLGHRVLFELQNYNPNPAREGKMQQEGYYNYFIGNDPSKHATYVGLYKEAIVKNVYEGIDLRYYFDNGNLRYDFVVQPYADASQIKFKLRGQYSVYTKGESQLCFTTRFGEVAMAELHTCQGSRTVPSKFVKNGDFWQIALGSYDRSKVLVIDPLIYSTYIGGSSNDRGLGIAVDGSGSAYVTGRTRSTDYDVTAGAFQTTNGGNWDVFVTKLNASGSSLVYSTYIGGSDDDYGSGIAVDGSGSAYVTGETRSTDYDVTAGAFQTTFGGGWNDVFVTKICPVLPFTLTSAVGTNNQTVCVGTPITNITYSTTATGVNVTGLPAGVTFTYTGGIVTISGTPTATGTFNYTVTPSCGTPTATGTITVNPNRTITLSSASSTANQTVCVGTPITTITYTTTNATGATVTGLPAGVTSTYSGGTVTISGTPTATGTFNYTVTPTGCGTATATGTITVNPNRTITLSSASSTANQTVCIGTPITTITYTTTNATGATVTGLPVGVTFTYSGGTVTISGTPTATGTFNYTVTPTGCGTATATGTIKVNSLPSVNYTVPASQDTVCSTDAPFTLTGGTPAGGTYSGGAYITGGNTFNPGLASIGSNMVIYSYTNANGCTNKDTAYIVVKVCTDVGNTGFGGSYVSELYPNPAQEVAYMSIKVPVMERVIVRLLGVEGKVLREVYEGSVIGSQVVSISTEDLPAGMYVCYVQLGSQVIVKRLVVSKG